MSGRSTFARIFAIVVPRAIYGGIVFLAGIYSILCYIPFVYTQFITQDFLPALTIFVRGFPLFFIAALASLAFGMRKPGMGWHGWSRRHLILFGVHAIAAVVLVFFPLRSLQDSTPSLVAGVLFFASGIWVALTDLWGSGRDLDWSGGDEAMGAESAALPALAATGVFLALAFLGVAHFRSPDAEVIAILARIGVESLVTHLATAMAVFTIVLMICGIADIGYRRLTEFVAVGVAGAAVFAWVLARLVMSALTLQGSIGVVLSVWIAMTSIAYLFATAVQFVPSHAWPSGLRMGLDALSFGLTRSRTGGVVAVLLGFGGVVAVGFYIPQRDYSLVLQQLTTFLIWALTFAGFFAIFDKPGRPSRPGLHYASAAVGFGVFILWTAFAPKVSEAAAEKYRSLDVSFRLVEGLAGVDAGPAGDSGEIFTLLEKHTNIPSTVPVLPVDVNLSEVGPNAIAVKPHIFLIVVDSLRRDYLGAYNAKVNFTPNIDAFAREGVVMKNSFTRYGATGLSEPSIWTGGMLIHKQYVLPFQPMNSLEKLVEQEGYRGLISRDTILDVIVKKDSAMTNIDEGIPNREYRLCDSFGRLKSLLDKERTDRPFFVYTQPQDIHVSVINRENRTVPKGESYPGFDAAYASRLHRIDTCFGAFIQDLKDRGIYDNSVVVLSADHGDSLGEGGRYGHAYTLFQEVVKVPLIIRLPAEMQKRLKWDANAIAFQADITPSLYYLLGRRPVRQDILGRPLFAESLDELKSYQQDHHLLASSYGPVWGILRENGRYLYIADGVNYTDYFYDLTADPVGESNIVSPSIRAEYRALIEKDIESLDKFYKFDLGQFK